MCPTACNKKIGDNPPLIDKSKIFVELTQKANPEIGTPLLNLPKNEKYEAILATPPHSAAAVPAAPKQG